MGSKEVDILVIFGFNEDLNLSGFNKSSSSNSKGKLFRKFFSAIQHTYLYHIHVYCHRTNLKG